MFGYIKICKDELKVRDFNLFRAYYCGLCKTLKREYGFPSRMGLSYDVTFLAVLLAAVSGEKPSITPERCIANPFQKKPVAQPAPYFTYTAAANVALTCLKLEDDIRDEHSVRAAFAMLAMLLPRKRMKKRYPELYEGIRLHIHKLTELEKNKCADIDVLANEFGLAMRHVFAAGFIQEESIQRVLSHMGYHLGRFIYILDAYEDMEKDRKKGSFNPFLCAGKQLDVSLLRVSLELTLSEVAKSYRLLQIRLNGPILDNIIYLGLCEALDKTIAAGKQNAVQNKGEQQE